MRKYTKREESLLLIERIRAGVRAAGTNGGCPQCGGSGLSMGTVREVSEDGSATVDVAICRGCDAADRMLAEADEA